VKGIEEAMRGVADENQGAKNIRLARERRAMERRTAWERASTTPYTAEGEVASEEDLQRYQAEMVDEMDAREVKRDPSLPPGG